MTKLLNTLIYVITKDSSLPVKGRDWLYKFYGPQKSLTDFDLLNN